MKGYWWLIIVLAVVAFIPVKMKLTKAFLKSRIEKQLEREKLLEDEEP